jgi:Kelch motif
MKKIYFLSFTIFSFFICTAQNIGIGTTTPKQKLDVNGAIKIGTTSTNLPGSIRYENGSFEGGTGSSWKSLEGLPAKAIILAQAADTIALKTAGFSTIKRTDIWDTSYIPVSTNYPGSWSQGFPLSSSLVTPAGSESGESVIYNQSLICYGIDAYLYQYDIAAQKWNQLPNICPLGIRNGCGVTLAGDEIFITGGFTGFSGLNGVTYNTAAKYNLVTNTWTPIANTPKNIASHATATIGTDIYIIGGITDNFSTFGPTFGMYLYNTLTNTWSGQINSQSAPGFSSSGRIVSRNNKLIFLVADILKVLEYAPLTDQLTDLTPAINYNDPNNISFDGYTVALAGDKLNIIGFVKDTVFFEPDLDKQLPSHYEVNLTTGNIIKLNSCKLMGANVYTFKYNAANDRFYALTSKKRSTGNLLDPIITTYGQAVFTRSVTDQCEVILKRKGYWSYMKKN